MRNPEIYKLTVKLPLNSRRYLCILKKRLGYKSLDRLVADIIDEKTHQMFSKRSSTDDIVTY